MRKSRKKIIIILILAVMFISLVIISLPALGFMFGDQIDKLTDPELFAKKTNTITTEQGDEFTHIYWLKSRWVETTYEHEILYKNKRLLIYFTEDEESITEIIDISAGEWIAYKIDYYDIIYRSKDETSFSKSSIVGLDFQRKELYPIYYQLLINSYDGFHFERLARELLSVGDSNTISLAKNYATGDFTDAELNGVELTSDSKIELQEISAQLVEEYHLNETE
jgi:hypothetical protein